MRTISLPSESIAVRKPTQWEQERIAAYVSEFYASRIKFGKRMRSLFIIIGIVLMSSAGQYGIVSIAVGLLCFAGAYTAVDRKQELKKRVELFRTGAFDVVDGIVYRIHTDPDMPGYSQMQLQTKAGELIQGNYRARQEGLREGLEAIAVSTHDDSLKRQENRAFTPFMLTDEGIRLHW